MALIEKDLGSAISQKLALGTGQVPPPVWVGSPRSQPCWTWNQESHQIRDALHYAREHLAENFPMEAMATAVGLSTRQFGRAFLAETGQTPARTVERLRAEAPHPRIEDSDESLEQIAASVGFGQAERMRQAFVNIFGQSPQSLRRHMRRGREATMK